MAFYPQVGFHPGYIVAFHPGYMYDVPYYKFWNSKNCLANERNCLTNEKIPRYVRWELPPTDVIKLNTDGSSRGNPGASGAGGLLRDSNGKWICGFSGKIGIATSIEAELWGIRKGMEIAWDMKIPSILVETDSLLAISLIKEPNTTQDHPLANLIEECRNYLSRSTWTIYIIHTRRDGNKCADFMAKISHDLDEPFHLFSSPPHGLSRILSDDVRP